MESICVSVLGCLCLTLSVNAQVSGSGSSNYLPRWTGSTTLGNSIVFQTNGRVGISTTNPTATLDVKGSSGTSASQTALTVLNVLGGNGVPGGSGGNIQFMSGIGGSSVRTLIPAKGGTGAALLVTGGSPATCVAATIGCAGWYGGNGGSITLQPGNGGTGSAQPNGKPGNISLAPSGGRVGVKTTNPTATFTVGIGASTLADQWMVRSSRRFKSNIQPLLGAMNKVMRLQGVTYDRKADGQHEIGFIAEDVERVIPELVSRDPESHEVQGMDYSRISALLIEALKSQQSELGAQRDEIELLKAHIEQLTSKTKPANR
jgi:hypothetical protein